MRIDIPLGTDEGTRSADMRCVVGEDGQYRLGRRLHLWGGRSQFFEVVDRPDLVFKEFRQPTQEVRRLRRLIRMGKQCAARGGGAYGTHIAWPRDVIVADAAVAGVMVPLDLTFLSDDVDALDDRLPRTFASLMTPEAPELALRLVLLAGLANAFVVLRLYKLTHGDISPANALWRLRPVPGICLVDVDGLRQEGDPAEVIGTPGYEDPRLRYGLRYHDKYSDLWGMLAISWRVLGRREQWQLPLDEALWLPAHLKGELREHFAAAFGDSRYAAARADPAAWRDSFVALAEDAGQMADLERELDALPRWQRPGPVSRARLKQQEPALDRSRPLVEPLPGAASTQPPGSPAKPKDERRPPQDPARPPAAEAAPHRGRRRIVHALAVLAVVAALLLLWAQMTSHEGTGRGGQLGARAKAAMGRVGTASGITINRCTSAKAGPPATAAARCIVNGDPVAFEIYGSRGALSDGFKAAARGLRPIAHPPAECAGQEWRFSNGKDQAQQGSYELGVRAGRPTMIWSFWNELVLATISRDGSPSAVCSEWRNL